LCLKVPVEYIPVLLTSSDPPIKGDFNTDSGRLSLLMWILQLAFQSFEQFQAENSVIESKDEREREIKQS
jgi:hypothetical protein